MVKDVRTVYDHPYLVDCLSHSDPPAVSESRGMPPPLEAEVEHWDDRDSDIEDDFPLMPNHEEDEEEDLDASQRKIIWWVVAFTAVFETLHTIPSRAIAWLLKFFWCLFTVLGQYSEKISKIAHSFPCTPYKRTQFLKKSLQLPSVSHMVVCPCCSSVFPYSECVDKCGSRMSIRMCPECSCSGRRTPLLKQIISQQGKQRFYPHLAYPVASLVSSLQALVSRPDFLSKCEHWRRSFDPELRNTLGDVYDGCMWRRFMNVDGHAFLSQPNSIGLMLNFDFFQPFKHRTYSMGVLYLVVMNLPRSIRFKRENLIIVGIIPGPNEPSLTINSFLTPLVSDLISLWKGLPFKTCSKETVEVRCALLCVACDIPAARKLCGFLGCKANLGCSRCYCNFGTGVFGKQDFSGFECDKWIPRTAAQHRDNVKLIKKSVTKTERERLESKYGCRYSSLLQLSYFDPINMTVIDPMHNLYLGTAKRMWSLYRKCDIVTDADVQTINSRLISLRIPSNVKFSSLPRIESGTYTAEQWMIWVNYYSLFCLHGILNVDQFENWRSFVLASRLLCKSNLTKDDVTIANSLLVHFCRRFQTIYSRKEVTPNMHLHCHIAECVRDFGPLASFWCFSFERFNGLLGDLPTNNRSIELQVMKRFVADNSHFQLLECSSDPSGDQNTSLFHQVVVDHVYQFHSAKHLDSHLLSRASQFSTGFEYVPAKKYVVAVLSESQTDVMKTIYTKLYPSLPLGQGMVAFSQSYRKMSSITINGQVFCAGDYASVKFGGSVEVASHSTGLLSLRPVKLWHFAIHTVNVDECTHITHGFAIVTWPMSHTNRHIFGKPYEVWCANLFESASSFPEIIPLEYIHSFLLSTTSKVQEENVLITVQLVV